MQLGVLDMISPRLENIYNEDLNVFKEPQIYKGIKFYPLLIKERDQSKRLDRIFGYPKRHFSEKDPTLFKMSYLKYLLLVIQAAYVDHEKPIDMSEDIEYFLKHITKAEEVSIEVVGNTEDVLKMILQVRIDQVIFTEEEFSDIREIVLEQNGISLKYIEDYDPTLEEDLNFVNRNQKYVYNFKDQIFAFAALFRKTIEEIEGCSMYQMKNLLESRVGLAMHEMQVISLTHVGEDYEFIPYMTKLTQSGRYDSILQTVDEFKKKSSYFKSDSEIATNK